MPDRAIAERVIHYRRARGWSQQELADRAGISQQTIGKIETGATQRSRFLPRVAKALGVPLEDLEPVDIALPLKQPPYPPELLAEVDAAGQAVLEQLRQLKTPVSVYRLSPIDDRESLFDGAFSGVEGRVKALADCPDAFGLYVSTDAMAPVIELGDVVLIHPTLHPVVGADCIFMTGEPSSRKARVIFGRLLRFGSGSWVATQFNPALEFEVSRDADVRAMRIVAIIRRG